ncbi:DNase I-like protein, partial [Panus rudis PR-1116 ss-1]
MAGARKKITKNTRARIKIASLNMRGFGNNTSNNKWNNIHRIIKEDRIGVLALQETHLTNENVDGLHAQYGRRLKILHTSDPDDPSQKAGVAIVLNKDITNIKDIRYTVIVPGRALLLYLPWHKNLKLSILAVYAPNASNENTAFWNKVYEFWNLSREPQPDIILGDMNIVEDSIDRFPPHLDDNNSVEALNDVKARFTLIDGWRTIYPDSREFTYYQSQTGSQSRIDRIYIKDCMRKSTSDWEIKNTGVNTDHKMVSVCVIDQKSPFIGPGRWSIPPFLLEDKEFRKQIYELGGKLATEAEQLITGQQLRSEEQNLQNLFINFKSEVIVRAEECAKVAGPKIKRQLTKLRKEVHKLSKIPEGMTELPQATIDNINIINKRITDLEVKRHQRAKLTTTARYRLEGETMSKYWT